MNKKNQYTSTFFLSLILIINTLVINGCRDKEETDNYGYVMIEDDSHVEAGENVPEPKLMDGQILVVRLIYDINEKDDDDAEWYKVQLSRVGKNWSDSVKIQGVLRSKTRHYDDYVFSSKNFNWQIEKEQYGIDTLNGDYEIDIQGSNGYHNTHRLHWTDGKWTNSFPTLTFSVR